MAWLASVVVLAVLLGTLIAGHRFHVRSDLLALLPAPQQDPVQSAAFKHMAGFGQRRLVLLIADADADKRRQAAVAAAHGLTASGSFDQVIARADDVLDAHQQKNLQRLYFSHRFHLLAPADAKAIDRLANGPDKPAAKAYFLDRARTALYGLGLGGGSFMADPLGLENAYRNAVSIDPAPNLRVAGDGRFYVTDSKGERYDVVFARTRADPFSMTAQSGQSDALAGVRAAVHKAAPQADLIMSGVLRHAAAASTRARFEMSVIGGGSLLGIVVLMLWAFRRIRPFLLSLAAIGGGILLAMIVTDAVFGYVHVLTLVFGASLVGIAIDYCLHFFAQRLATPDPRQALRQVLRPVSLGLATSVLAYGGMAIAPFPGLRQIAVFAATGLVGAWLGMVLLLPGAAGRTPRAGRALALARGWQDRGPGHWIAGHERATIALMSGLLLVFGLVAAWQLTPDDDIRVLYNPPPALMHADRRAAQLLGSSLSTRAILVRGDSPQAVLKRESALIAALQSGGQPVAQYSAITQAYPPLAVQKRHYAELAQTLYAPDGALAHFLQQTGLKPAPIKAALDAFTAQRGQTLALSDWLASPASAGLRDLWLGRIDGQYASLVRLRQIDDPAALKRILAGTDQTSEIDRVADISARLGHYRRLASWMLGVEYLLAGLLLACFFGLRGALSLLLAPLLASISVLFVFAITGWTFSLFNLVALILLLGLGADYGIFLRTGGRGNAPAMLAVMLSVATTLLAFGLLALSHTPALHEFGLTLALGLPMTFLLASLLGGGPTENDETDAEDNTRHE